MNGPRGVITCSRGLNGSNHWILPIKGREQHVPDSSNHALFAENERNFRGNQLPDGSIGLSPLPKRACVALAQTTLNITVSGRCACVCVWVWCVGAVLCVCCAVSCGV